MWGETVGRVAVEKGGGDHKVFATTNETEAVFVSCLVRPRQLAQAKVVKLAWGRLID